MKSHFNTLFDDVETRGNSKCKQKCIKNYMSNKKKDCEVKWKCKIMNEISPSTNPGKSILTEI